MKRDTMIALRLTREERERLEEAAHRAALPLSAWLRLVALAAAGDEEFVRQLAAVSPGLVVRE